MLINIHCHIAPHQTVDEWFATQELDKADVTVVCGDWDMCEKAINAMPDRVIALGRLHYDDEDPALVDQARDRGFRGLKIIETTRPYDDPAYYPIYEKAVEYDMPILFHTGHLLLRKEQHRNVISRHKMDIVRLDGIARAFPELKLIGAHLGNPQYEDACSLVIKHPGIYCDLTGGTVRKLPYNRWRQLLMTAAEDFFRSRDETLDLKVIEKFVFGTDGQPISPMLEFHENLFEAFGFPEQIRELILWRNVARMFGIEEELEERAKK